MERKLATVLFVDLVDSTSLVTGSDPEIVRRRVTEFFEHVERCVTTHGGIVEKFAGDAVIAAFGIPQAHEDDAERAVRAALAMREAIHELGLEVRIGVESGEVVADAAGATFATGAAVNVAARLQQAAGPGEILIGQGVRRLAGKVDAEDLGPLELKGIPGPTWAWRVVAATSAQPGRRLGAPLIGRDEELDLLSNTFARALRNRRAHLFTVYGEPGVGKSRLTREFVEGLEGVTVLSGRCLPYGEGVTYWPLAEMVKAAAGIADDDPLDVAIEKLRESCEDEAIADLLGLASGVLEAVQGERSQQEIAWAARAWAEQLAQEQPLVVVFEDIHWAEEPLLELIEHLAEWVRASPLLIICLARAELLEIRPNWGGGRLRATAIELEPLPRAESERLVDALLVDGTIEGRAREELLEKTEGNPLFVEETVRMLAECEGRALSDLARQIPDTLQALIAARVDRLPDEERTAIQRAAVIGRVFWGGAIAHLAPELEDLEAVLQALLLRDLVVPEARSTITGETAYRFKHVLIREVAYSGLSKESRAQQHARFAEWLARRAGEELLEIRAYHLDQAASLHAELDGAPPPELAREAAAALEEAGRRALGREANRSARNLFVRAVELDPTLERRFEAARAAWRLTDLPAVSIEMERVRIDAQEAQDRRIEARALTALAEVALLRDAEVRKAEGLARRALDVADPDDLVARFDAFNVLRTCAWWSADLEQAESFAREVLEIAQRAGRKDLESQAATDLAHIFYVRDDLADAEPLVERAHALAEESGSIIAKANALWGTADLHAYRGELAEAQQALEQALELFSEAGAGGLLGRVQYRLGRLVWRRGDLVRAERLYREAIRLITRLEDRGTLVEAQRSLALLLLELGKLDEAERYALVARETVGAEDVTSRASTAHALGVVRAAQGRDEEAEALLREAISILEPTGCWKFLDDPVDSLAQFLRERGRDDEAAALEGRFAESAARTA